MKFSVTFKSDVEETDEAVEEFVEKIYDAVEGSPIIGYLIRDVYVEEEF